ncbi:hypothetical protein LCGC14_1384820 [marine sediment metagenome]|uniref:Uncharacterized protein n=1 Tax=marine sediment metagenome TaxID=412755 RepID=A0A0F9KMI8_9ZZZZ
MSLLEATDLMTIKLYYEFKKVGEDQKLIILEDDKAEELLLDPIEEKRVEVLETKWSPLSWKDQNDVMAAANKNIDPVSGERQFDFIVYRDSIIKRCLKSWDMKVNDKDVPVNASNIDKLPAKVVIKLYDKYNDRINYTEDEAKN